MRTKDRAAVKTAGSIPLSNYTALEKANRKSNSGKQINVRVINLAFPLSDFTPTGSLFTVFSPERSFRFLLMKGWINEWIDGQIDEWIDGWMNG